MSSRTRRFTAALRLLCAVQACLVLLQAVLAGHFLTGNAPTLLVHETIATSVITWVGFTQVATAVLLWRPGQGPAWPIPATIVLFAVVVLQLGWGFHGRLALHIPVGVGLLAAQLVMGWTLPGRSRPAADSKAGTLMLEGDVRG